MNAERETTGAVQKLEEQGEEHHAAGDRERVDRLEAREEAIRERRRFGASFGGHRRYRGGEVAGRVALQQRVEVEAGVRRRKEEDRRAEEVDLDRAEVGPTAAGEKCVGQSSGVEERG